MEKGILAGQDFDEAPELLDPHHFSFVDLSHLGFFDQGFDPLFALLGTLLVGSPDRDAAVVIDGDRTARILLDLLDRFP